MLSEMDLSTWCDPNPARRSFTAMRVSLLCGCCEIVVDAHVMRVTAHFVRGRWFTWLAWINGVLLVVLSLLTFYGLTLRP